MERWLHVARKRCFIYALCAACTKARQELKELFPTGKATSLNELKVQKQRLTQKRNEAYDRYTTERYRHR